MSMRIFYDKSYVSSALNNKQAKLVEAPAIVTLGQSPDYTYFIDSSSMSYPLFNSRDIVWTRFNNNISPNISNEFKNTYLTTTAASLIYARADELSNFETTTSMLNSIYQTITGMSSYVTSGSLLDYQPVANMATYITSGSLTAYQTIADLTKSSVGLGNVDNTGASSLPISTATQTALGLKANIESPIFTGTPKLTISSLNYDLITQPRVGGWFQFSGMTVQKQIGLNNFSVARSAGHAAGSFDISFPAHPARWFLYDYFLNPEVVKRCSCFIWIRWCYKLHRIYC